ncbi:phage regulatory protein/antirepressor Ant [Pseudomonas sp. R5(2019)]|uniref:phage regulatory protein/antirepressor Ant n=1 Tax=Pseudomonas sp. R5(2019) TaxID=2697566 RepID=UPI0014132DFE|nr:phage regulatory protein/antirepressor Ant [Pseudomonas sp. R5(2019)]NBA95530.1 DNA-binding protein [Pseudomonas sp. R5(2019)]
MSSREIAELTGKRHANVKRDTIAMLAELKKDVLSFEHIYLDGQNREQTEYLLDREHTDCLLTGYSAGLRMKVIRRWRELESRVVDRLQVPTNFAEALRLAAEQVEQNQQLQQVIQQQAPKVEALNRLANTSGSICITEAAKHLGVSPLKLFGWLASNRWIYRRSSFANWSAFQPRLSSGVLEHKLVRLKNNETEELKVVEQVMVTRRGLVVLAEKIGASL